MRKIALEEHFYTEEYLQYLRSRKTPPRREVIEDENGKRVERCWDSIYDWDKNCFRDRPLSLSQRLLELGEKRIGDMNRAGIDLQVLILSNPGVELFGVEEGRMMASKTNDELAHAIEKYPDRFVGFAAIAPDDPQGAASEMERAVKELGFKGVNINSHVNGQYLDDERFWPIFEKAQRLGVPVSIHPREPSPDMARPYSKYPILLGAALGFGAEVSLHVMRLICSGLFDEFPDLRIIIGHLGEGLPFWLWRIDNRWSTSSLNRRLKRKPGDYFRENIFVTTSGMFSEPAFMCAYSVLGAERILFAVDYPYESNEEAVAFIERLPIPESDKEKVCRLNAERLLKIRLS